MVYSKNVATIIIFVNTITQERGINMRKKKDDRLKPVSQDENEKPEVYAMLKHENGIKLNRRAFLGSVSVGLLTSLSGCESQKPTEKTKKSTMPIKKIETNFCLGFKAHSSLVTSVVISPNGKLLVSGSYDKALKLWNLPEGKLIKTLTDHLGFVRTVAISPDGKLLASGSNDKAIKLWNLPEGKLIKTLTGHLGPVGAVAISPDGKLLASGSNDKAIKLWDLPKKKLLKTLTGHSNSVGTIAISPDGKLLASGDIDNAIKLWIFPEGKPNWCLFNYDDTEKSIAYSYRQMDNTVCTCDTIVVPSKLSVSSNAECVCNTVSVGSKPKPAPSKPVSRPKPARPSPKPKSSRGTRRSSSGHYWRPN